MDPAPDADSSPGWSGCLNCLVERLYQALPLRSSVIRAGPMTVDRSHRIVALAPKYVRRPSPPSDGLRAFTVHPNAVTVGLGCRSAASVSAFEAGAAATSNALETAKPASIRREANGDTGRPPVAITASVRHGPGADAQPIISSPVPRHNLAVIGQQPALSTRLEGIALRDALWGNLQTEA